MVLALPVILLGINLSHVPPDSSELFELTLFDLVLLEIKHKGFRNSKTPEEFLLSSCASESLPFVALIFSSSLISCSYEW